MLAAAKENQKLRENNENQDISVLMDDIENLRLQILEEFRKNEKLVFDRS